MPKLFEVVDPSQLQDVLRGVPELGESVELGSGTNFESRVQKLMKNSLV
jgi:hypothetical protein